MKRFFRVPLGLRALLRAAGWAAVLGSTIGVARTRAAEMQPTLPSPEEVALLPTAPPEVAGESTPTSEVEAKPTTSGTEIVALQPMPPIPLPVDPNVTVLEPTEVVGVPPVAPTAPVPPPPANPYANTVFDSPFFAAPTEGYAPGNSTTATKLNIPNMDFPGIVNTITEDLIRDRQSFTFDQALRNVPNVVPRTGAGFRSDEFFIRGFNVGFGGNDFRKDGFRDSSWAMREVQNIERIEVLKGPASILYGAASQPAGVINVITKKPLPGAFADFDAQFGSYDLYRTTGDINARWIGTENVLGRFNYAVQTSDSFRDFVFVNRTFIAPSTTFILSPDTNVTVSAEYLHDSRITDRGLVFVPLTPAGNPFFLPKERFLGQPTDKNNYEDGQFNIFLNHEFFDGAYGRFGYVSNWSGEQRNNYDTRGVVGNNVTRQFVQQRSMAQDHYFIGDLTAEFGQVFQHQALVGTELGTTINDVKSRNSVVTGFPLNFNNPYTTPGANYFLYPATPTLAAPLISGSQQNNYGVYFQDMIELGPRFKAMLGLRTNWYDLKSFNQNVKTQQSWTAWTPRYGLVYQPLIDDLSFYAGYSETFNPVAGFLQNGDALTPESGFGFDVGTKLRLRDQLWLTIGYFDIERNNVAQAIPNSNPQRFQQFGLVRSTGMEIELAGQLTDRWTIINGYGMADARIENDRVAANVGKHLTNSPYWNGNLWTRYNFIQRDQLTVGMGFGMYYTSFWHISADNAYAVPGYARFDMGTFHDIGRWRSALFIENLTDVDYIAGANGNTTVAPGAPISLRGTIGVSF
jgi:iron complex outermembrane receptor protein